MGGADCGHLELDLLRFWQLRRDGEIVHVALRQQRLIAALAIRGPRARNYVAGLLWPDCPEPRALESLRVSVHMVSRQVPGLLAKDGSVLALDPVVEVDLNRVRAMLQETAGGTETASVRQESGTGSAPKTALLALRDADLLPGWYEDWVVFEQSRLHQDRLHALTLLSRSLLATGDCECAVEAATAALEIEPLYESAVRALVTAELALGNPVSALHAYENYATALRRDTGILPSEALDNLIKGLAGPLSVLGGQPLPDRAEDFLPVRRGQAAVLPGALAVGDAGAEPVFAVGLPPGADHQGAAAAGDRDPGPARGAVVGHGVL